MTDPGTRVLAILGVVAMLGILVLLLRWTFATGRDQPGLRLTDPDDPTGLGLLEEVSRVPTEAAAHVLRSRLHAAGVRATVARGPDLYRILVFPADLGTAKLVLRGSAPE
ncbi:hypothetical protein [Pseudonocardia sp.]|uniref:hypothetical protein n=1 Tax=Pseudonocardia sp. TaxID=60912 RepID=UPI0026162217|nr:hypothetical protein [Pseudonocardia sp.]